MKVPNEKRFLKDVKDHVMEIRRDDGLYRNIRFRNPGTVCYYFDITTWPGCLCISGDMGFYVFSRIAIADMFEFFRGQKPCIRGDRTLGINLDYWHEKVQAECKTDGCREYDPREFKRVINKIIYSGGWPKAVRQEVKEDVLGLADEGKSAALTAAYEFCATHEGEKYQFNDLWDYGDYSRYTYRFVWVCYAIVWAIQMYDLHKLGEAQSA